MHINEPEVGFFSSNIPVKRPIIHALLCEKMFTQILLSMLATAGAAITTIFELWCAGVLRSCSTQSSVTDP